MKQRYRWVIHDNDEEKVEKLVKEYRLPHVIATIALKRKLDTEEKLLNFFYPQVSHFYSPFLLKDCEKAIERILIGIEKNEKFMIFGDYDADGITSVALLLRFLKKLNAKVSFYIPDRHREGYGLKSYFIEKAHSENIMILICVDCGISSTDEIKKANQYGIDVIILDHHEPLENLPPAYAIVNPKRKDCNYPFKNLAAVGIVMKLILAMSEKLEFDKNEVLKEVLDITALGTIGDMVELVEENRLIVKKGLQMLRETRNVGICSLCEIQGLRIERGLSVSDVSCSIIPKLNAASRVWDSKMGLELLLLDDYAKAKELAKELENKNKLRGKIEEEILQMAIRQLEESEEWNKEKVIILKNDDWNVGIIGIVASKLMEIYKMPAILIGSTFRKDAQGEEKLVYQGSMRSFGSINVMSVLSKCEDLLVSFGAHQSAGGFTLIKNNLDEFCLKVKKAIREMWEEGEKGNLFCLEVDALLDLNEINAELNSYLDKLEPFGVGNPEPLFFAKNVSVLDASNVGKDGKHLKLKLGQGDKIYDAIGFRLGDVFSIKELYGANIDIVYTIKKRDNLFGKSSMQIQFKDLRESKL